MSMLRTLNQRVLDIFVVNPSVGRSLGYLDGVRAVAVIFVLAVHAWQFGGEPSINVTVPFTHRVLHLTALMAYTQVGVDLFFVLSGYLLAQPWLRADYQRNPRPNLRRYFSSRFFRIAPAYYACLFLTLLFFTPKFIMPTAIYSRVGAFSVSMHLIFMEFLFPYSGGSWGILGQFWTLTIEVMFYLILPWAIVFFLRNRWVVTVPIVFMVTLTWLYLCRHSLGPVVHFYQTKLSPAGIDEASVRWILAKQLPGHLVHFALGMTLANIVVRYQLGQSTARSSRVLTHPTAGKIYFAAGCAVVIACMNWVSVISSHYGYSYQKLVTERGARIPYYLAEIPFAIGFTLLLGGVIFGGPWLQYFFGCTPLRVIGILGYSIYLWHVPLLYLFSSFPSFVKLAPPQRFPAVLGTTSVALVVLCTGFYLAVEKPFILKGENGEAYRCIWRMCARTWPTPYPPAPPYLTIRRRIARRIPRLIPGRIGPAGGSPLSLLPQGR